MINAKFGKQRRMPRISHHPVVPRYYLVIAVILVMALAGMLLMIWFSPVVDGKDLFGSQVRSLENEIDSQRDTISDLMKKNVDLQEKYTKMEHLREIDQQSLSMIQGQLKSYQDERLKMEEELVFLRGMISSKLGKGILHLQWQKLEPGKEENSFLYAFTVSKVIKDSEYLEGAVHVEVTGEQDGKQRSLPLVNVDKGGQEEVKMRFKYFQNIEGEFLIPDGFKPSGVTIEVKPVGEKFKPVKKSFKWAVTS